MIKKIEELIEGVNRIMKEKGWENTDENYIEAVKIYRRLKGILLTTTDGTILLDPGAIREHKLH